jgi:hypothetical protein
MTQQMRRYRNIAYDSARWEEFRFRDDDIVISTPPKCGTTWMQMMCALIIFQDPVLPSQLTELSPWLDFQTASLSAVIAALEAQDHRRFIKTHTPLDGIPFNERVTYICVGRDPRDVALSWDNHWSNMNREVFMAARAEAVGMDDLPEILPNGMPEEVEDPLERFWQWVEADASPMDAQPSLAMTLVHLNSFWDRRHLDNVALFHYADLQADLGAEMRRLAGILAIAVHEDKWSSLVSAATFNRMRERANELAPEVKMPGLWRDDERFFNKGTTGQWRELISEDDLPRYEARLCQLAHPDLVAWVQSGGHAGRSKI